MTKMILGYLVATATLFVMPFSLQATASDQLLAGNAPRIVALEACASGACDRPWPFVKCCSIHGDWLPGTWCWEGNCGAAGCPDDDPEG